MEERILLALQAICFSVSMVMALLLLFSRVHLKRTSTSYETARWTLFAAMTLLSIHYALQMVFRFREEGDDVGALVNILFYSPTLYLFSYTTLSLASGRRKKRRYLWMIAINLCLIYGAFLIGLYVYGSLHMQHALNTIAALFAFNVLFFILYPLKEMDRVRRKLEMETSDDLFNYDIYMRTGTTLLLCTCLLVPIAIFSLDWLVWVAPLYLLGLVFYMVNFIALGYNSSVFGMMEAQDGEIPWVEVESLISEIEGVVLREEEIIEIEKSVAIWKMERGFSKQNLNTSIVARRLNISRVAFNRYLKQCQGKTFSVWLSDLRLEEAKRMLSSSKNYSLETIAFECGFSSRSWMQEKFKAKTGMPPLEWKQRAGF